jgi:OCT family organic cation transporter-like MFS transporter 4/5
MTAKWNGTANELPEEMMAQLISDCEEEAGKGNKTNTVLDLFRTFNLRVKTLVLAYAWTVCSALYYVLLLDQSELSSDPYLGFVVTAAVQLPGYLYVIFTLERPFFGRKRSMCAFLVLSGLCLCIHPCISGRSQPMLKVAVSIFGRFCANCSYTILNLFSAEQFPTVVRGVGVGFTLVVSRFGTILAPYILLLGPHAPILFGIAAVSAGLVSLVLPETLGHPLPETIEDGEARGLATFPLIKTIFST